jgi:hypothetical protein
MRAVLTRLSKAVAPVGGNLLPCESLSPASSLKLFDGHSYSSTLCRFGNGLLLVIQSITIPLTRCSTVESRLVLVLASTYR